MGQLTGIFFEVDAVELHPTVVTGGVACGVGQFDLDLATETERLIVLCELIVLR